jgi:hypothetical protein
MQDDGSQKHGAEDVPARHMGKARMDSTRHGRAANAVTIVCDQAKDKEVTRLLYSAETSPNRISAKNPTSSMSPNRQDDTTTSVLLTSPPFASAIRYNELRHGPGLGEAGPSNWAKSAALPLKRLESTKAAGTSQNSGRDREKSGER